jgi:hypothetical protein
MRPFPQPPILIQGKGGGGERGGARKGRSSDADGVGIR